MQRSWLPRWWYGRWRDLSYRPRRVVGVVLIVMLVLCGVNHVHSWPLPALAGAFWLFAMTTRGAAQGHDLYHQEPTTVIGEAPPGHWRCGRCAKVNSLDDEFCARCGADGKAAIQAVSD